MGSGSEVPSRACGCRFASRPAGPHPSVGAGARRGYRARYMGSFGADELGRLSRGSLEQEGVDLTASRVVSSATNQFAVILVDARSGERTVLWDRHPALTMEPADLPMDGVQSGRILLVDCNATSTRVTKRSGRASPTSCSTSTPSSRPKNFRPP